MARHRLGRLDGDVDGLNAGLQTLVGWTAEKIGITQAAVEAFMIARSAVIPSLVSQTNRDEWVTLNATNFFGQNTPGIVERDTEYFGEHWPHNSSVGWTYSGALSALVAALAVPPPIAPMGASPAAPAAAASAVSQAAAQTGMSDAVQVRVRPRQAAGQTASSPADATGQLSSLMQQPMQMLSSATEPLQGATQAPMQAVQGFTSLPAKPDASDGRDVPVVGRWRRTRPLQRPCRTFAAGGGRRAASAPGRPAVPAGSAPSRGAGLTSYTRPTSSFEPEAGGRPTGLRAGVLNAAEVRGPTTSGGMGGAPMPMSPAGMLAHGKRRRVR